MTYGICNCTTGPPPGGRCNACGALGRPYYAPIPVTQPPVRVVHWPPVVSLLTEDDVRRIVREELFVRDRLREAGDGVA